ncbi:MAG TPA: hypothetical protein DCW90_18285 [Lachnospiraceae bacterium]|nr:hypothetical protein [Lachnospiraceae bacterium]
MKLVLNDQTNFELSHVNLMKSKAEDTNADSNRIDIVFAEDVKFAVISAVDEALYNNIKIVTADETLEYTGYAFQSLNQHIDENSNRLTLTLFKA